VPRSVEEFTEGDWVEELLGLGAKLDAHEIEQRKQEQAAQEAQMNSIAALKAKLETPAVPEKNSWLRRWRAR
jgi:hypothetical protein